jgi:hypothetical protein
MESQQQQQQQQQQQALQDEYDALNAAITKLGSQIRALKKKNESSSVTTSDTELAVAIQSLQQLKITAAVKQASLIELQQQQSSSATTSPFSRKLFDDLIVRKMFIVPSFEIHGGVKGLFDLGPPACALKVTTTIDYWCGCRGMIFTYLWTTIYLSHINSQWISPCSFGTIMKTFPILLFL